METPRVEPERSSVPKTWMAKFEYFWKLGIVLSIISSIGVYLTWPSSGMSYFIRIHVIKSPEEATWAGSLLPLGAILGSILPVGILADTYGRKLIVWITTIPLLISWFVICFLQTKTMFYAARFFAGIGCGAASVVVPIYFYEVTDSSVQRHIVHHVHRALNLGMVWPYIVYSLSNNDPDAKPFEVPKILLTALISCYSMAMLILPESPMWLEDRGQKEEAERAIKKMTGTYVKLDGLEPVKVIGNSGLRMSIFGNSNKENIGLVLSFITLQQLTGIGPLMFYLIGSYRLMVYRDVPIWVYYVILLVPILIASFNTKLHQYIGEKFLLIISTCLMVISGFCLACLAFVLQALEYAVDIFSNVLVLILLTVYLTAFHIGLGPVPWIMIGKLFPSNSRKAMYNVALTYSWMLLFIVTQSHTDVVQSIGMYGAFIIYTFVSLFGMFCAICCVPRRIREVQGEILENLDDVHASFALSN